MKRENEIVPAEGDEALFPAGIVSKVEI